MNTKFLVTIIITCIIVLLVPFSIITICNWCYVKIDFFHYTLVDIINIIVALVFGLGITLYLSNRSSNYSKKAEIVFECIDSVLNIYKRIAESFEDCNNAILNEEQKKRFLKLFKDASKEISNLNEYISFSMKPSIAVKTKVKGISYITLGLKRIITDNPFSPHYKITMSDVTNASDKYYEIKGYIQKIKMLMFE